MPPRIPKYPIVEQPYRFRHRKQNLGRIVGYSEITRNRGAKKYQIARNAVIGPEHRGEWCGGDNWLGLIQFPTQESLVLPAINQPSDHIDPNDN
jgi:hypothetical protein